MKNKVFFAIGILTALLTVAGGFVSCDQTSASVGRLIVNITDADYVKPSLNHFEPVV